ncbi:hypothetical protein P29A0810_202 [Synechococcus phage S-CAM8]|uniref:Gp226 n=1 Tax=Synechococcus phage S-CAM8 TaxID=754038 RepID=A0A1D8KNB9_9CAUD|nr:hypothetical protein P29A0810_202 [Synechococcus phage S-CAM8]
MSKSVKMVHKDCDPSLIEDRSLPYTTYMVEYLQDGVTKFDIVSSSKRVDIFDQYWDLYKKDFVNMTQTEGRINPRLWTDPNEKKKKTR